jgi:hypothetical protein
MSDHISLFNSDNHTSAKVQKERVLIRFTNTLVARKLTDNMQFIVVTTQRLLRVPFIAYQHYNRTRSFWPKTNNL